MDQAVEAEAGQVVARLAGGVVGVAEVSGDEPAKALVGEAGDGWEVVAESAGQSRGAFDRRSAGSGSLALVVGLVDALKERRAGSRS